MQLTDECGRNYGLVNVNTNTDGGNFDAYISMSSTGLSDSKKTFNDGEWHSVSIFLDFDIKRLTYFLDGKYWYETKIPNDLTKIKTIDIMAVAGVGYTVSNPSAVAMGVDNLRISHITYDDILNLVKDGETVPDYLTGCISYDVSSENTGNIFFDKNIEFDIKMKNTYSSGMVRSKIEICKESGELVKSDVITNRTSVGGVTESTYSFKAPEYGLYLFMVSDENGMFDKTVRFSVCNLPEDGVKNSKLGADTDFDEGYRGTPSVNMPLISKAGFGIVREAFSWRNSDKDKTGAKLTERHSDFVERAQENNINISALVSGGNTAYTSESPPKSDDAIAAYADYCGRLAALLKGKAEYTEVWNEYMLNGFNIDNLPPEDYARLIKAAYKAIKAANPEAIVLGLSTSGLDAEWAERVFAVGGLDYMDGLALHPYMWTPGTFDWQKLIDYSETMKEMMRKYGGEKPIWFTELGFSSSSGRYSVEEQAYNSVMLYALMNSNKVADGLTQYVFYNRWDKDEVEHNWGFLNWNDDPDNPSTAKPAYLAACAMNNFVGKGVADYKEFIRTDTKYRAFKFYNNKMNKDVILINSDDTEAYLSYDLGCDAVDVYDAYGNKIDTLSSGDGIYTFNMTQEPKYVIGNFNKFSLAEGYAPKIQAGITETESASDDVISFEYKNNTGIDDKNLHIKAELPECISVNENNGFSDNSAELKLYTLPKAAGKLVYKISVVDDNGNVYYSEKHKIKIVDPIKLDFAAEKAVETSDTHWRVRVNIINTSNTNTVGGTLTVTKPSEEAEFIAPRTFSNLKARETTTLLLNLPPRVTKQTFDLELKVTLDNGNEYTYSGRLDFGSSAYAEKKPTIDGVVSTDEWLGSWVGADNIKDVREIIDWRGPEDLSFSGISMWDEDYFYLLSIVTDDIYSLDYSPKEPHYMYRGDNIQFGLSDKVDIDSARVRDFTEFGVAEVPNYGSLVYRYKSLYNLPTAQIVSNAEAAVKRYDTYTVFECKIPWSEIFQEGFVPKSGQVLRFSLMANDNDGNSRRGWIEYTSGIGAEKLVTDFGSLVLSK
ncbi:MAG: hypothetical protein KH216_06910 [Clostridiales bacterium]|nr:hypothetical protein [Clostridiales bacterium]